MGGVDFNEHENYDLVLGICHFPSQIYHEKKKKELDIQTAQTFTLGFLHLLLPHQEPSSPIYPEAPPSPASFPSTLKYLLNHPLLNNNSFIFLHSTYPHAMTHDVFNLFVLLSVSPLQAPRMIASWNF